MSLLAVIALYLAAFNALAFAAFGVDKLRADQGGARVPERALMAVAVLGGGMGALAGQRWLNHAPRPAPFRSALHTTIALQLVTGAAFVTAGMLWLAVT